MDGRFGEGEWGIRKRVQRTLCVKRSICEFPYLSILSRETSPGCLGGEVGVLLLDVCGRVGLEWGKMSMVGQSRSLGILFCMPKIKESMMKRSTFLLFHWNRKSKIRPVIISSLAFTPETSDSLCAILPEMEILDFLHPKIKQNL